MHEYLHLAISITENTDVFGSREFNYLTIMLLYRVRISLIGHKTVRKE